MTSDDLAPSLVTIDGIEGPLARVELPDGSTEDWSLASLYLSGVYWSELEA